MHVSTYTRKSLYVASLYYKIEFVKLKIKKAIKMNRARLIQVLILAVVVSLAFAGVYAAGEAGEVSNADSTDDIGGLYISGSGDVCHVASCYEPLSAISMLEL